MIPARFEAKIERIPECGCWLWTGALSSGGYGNVKCGKQYRSAHRVLYELLVGAVPVGLDLDHLCRVRSCVNPSHLEPVSRFENLRRGGVIDRLVSTAATRNAAVICKRGHSMTPENTYTYPNGKHRACRICQRAHGRRWAAEKRMAA